MLKRRTNQITGQIGEYLVAAELCRRGFFSTTFTANVPHYDIIATNDAGYHIPVQVKAINAGSWQLNIKNFCNIQMDEEKQILGDLLKAPIEKDRRFNSQIRIENRENSDDYSLIDVSLVTTKSKVYGFNIIEHIIQRFLNRFSFFSEILDKTII